MATKAHLEGNARHIAKLDSMLLRPYKAEGAEIRAAAAAAGRSVQAYNIGGCAPTYAARAAA